MVLVPREATEAMLDAGLNEMAMDDSHVVLANIYKAMTAAAPSATAPTDEALREILARIYDAGGYVSTAGILRHSKDSNATWIAASIEELRAAMRRVSLSAPREEVLEEAVKIVRKFLGGSACADAMVETIRALKTGTKP